MLKQGKQNNKFDVANILRDVLLNDTEVQAIVDNRIYPVIAPEGTKGAFVTYTRSAYNIDRTHMGIYQQTVNIAFACVSRSYDESQRLATAIFNALEGYHSVKDGQTVVNSCEMMTAEEDYTADAYINYLAFSVK
jgi:hypothetical protein